MLSHITDDRETARLDCVDMDTSSPLEVGSIECNVPVMSPEQQSSIEGQNPSVKLLPPGYEHCDNYLDEQLELGNDKKFVCSISMLRKLFAVCMDLDCNMPLVEVKETFVGCVLEIRWRCKAGHRGDWQSSKMINRVYANNVQVASSLLYTGNNYTKLSLFSKCFRLAFFSASTFHQYQKKYLAPQVHSWWNVMESAIFTSLGDQPVIVAGDGQMDSPGFSAKNCTYTLMHVELDYVLHVKVVDVRHSQLKSVVMEKVGCERALDFLMGKLKVTELVSDASSQIIKMLGKYYILLKVK